MRGPASLGRDAGTLRPNGGPARTTRWLLGTVALGGLVAAGAATASDLGLRLSLLAWDSASDTLRDPTGPLGLIFLGLVIFSAVIAILHVRSRQAWAERDRLQRDEIEALHARLARADALLDADAQVIVAWTDPEQEPLVEGDALGVLDAPVPRRVLAFGAWLGPEDAKRLTHHVDLLKANGTAFAMAVESSLGKRLTINGQAVSGRAVLRIREVTGLERDLQRALANVSKLAAETAALQALLDGLPHPIWLRHGDGQLAWTNRAFAEALGFRSPQETVQRGQELMDSGQMATIHAAHRDGQPFTGRLMTVLGGKRRMLDVVDVVTPMGSGGMAVDAGEAERAAIRLQTQANAHQQILQALPVAVAVFHADGKLAHANRAFGDLWGLPESFLREAPGEAQLLDRLRAERRLPEQGDYRGWRDGVLDPAAGDRSEDWHLPDGRVLRVSRHRTADGGHAVIYQDLTEALRLQAAFAALTSLRDETFEHLKEGVAVFGADGRLRLSNGAFAAFWDLPAEVVSAGNARLLQEGGDPAPHITAVIEASPLCRHSDLWRTIAMDITDVADRREARIERIERGDGRIIECSVMPLPQGLTMLTFADVTDEVQAARMLAERNEALEMASRVKDTLVSDVSYELRTPLQNVTGYVSLLAEGHAGPLTPKQQDYANTALKSAEILKLLMDDIFDLASYNAGALSLDYADTGPNEAVQAALAALSDSIGAHGVLVTVDIPEGVGTFRADPSRVKQVLYKLLSNAIGFSERGQTVRVDVRRVGDSMVFTVRDEGRGIPKAYLDTIFRPFESHSGGMRHRGVGLGLPLVQAFMTLHGGSVTIESEEGRGTVAVCRFPIREPASAAGAPARAAGP